ncbi:hypothetical protein [Streptomyces sp. CRN 30]|uniref:hypothetical protein n=1 Tax=Streptomyces sp. CRN 30 TaxID=3075613 RepID=UPI002A8053C3|nr:hypothetical protein [Streptomyces sp. CRN 30]
MATDLTGHAVAAGRRAEGGNPCVDHFHSTTAGCSDVRRTVLWLFVAMLCFLLLFHVITDVSHDDGLAGWGKEGGIVRVMVLPVIGLLVHVIRLLARYEQSARGESALMPPRDRTLPKPDAPASGRTDPAGRSTPRRVQQLPDGPQPPAASSGNPSPGGSHGGQPSRITGRPVARGTARRDGPTGRAGYGRPVVREHIRRPGHGVR